MFDGKTILVTGGTGSFGQHFIQTVLKQYKPKKVIVYSRDELKQFEMQQKFGQQKALRYFIGDVRDLPRLTFALRDVDIVVHAAALKQVPAAEYNPFECIKTNVIGGQNVIDAALASPTVSRILALSTDKAAAPINLYGATKLCSDKLFVASNNYKGTRDLKVSVVRYGNVMGSRGSVIPFFREAKNKGEIPITDPRMTRFSITLTEGVNFTIKCIERMWGGEIFIPKIPSYKIPDVAEAVAPGIPTRNVGIRPGEKLHEVMITETDALSTIEFKDYYVILPSIPLWDLEEFKKKGGQGNGKPVKEGFCYSSDSNDTFLTVNEIRSLVETNLH